MKITQIEIKLKNDERLTLVLTVDSAGYPIVSNAFQSIGTSPVSERMMHNITTLEKIELKEKSK